MCSNFVTITSYSTWPWYVIASFLIKVNLMTELEKTKAELTASQVDISKVIPTFYCK